MYFKRAWIETSGNIEQMTNFRNLVDASGLVWFLVGNVWVFSDENCSSPASSPVYSLCVTMLIINTIQICLPCIIALAMIPFICLCMPCLIRILARLQNQNAPKGATDTLINTLPLQNVTERLSDDDRTCAVCLNDMDIGEEVRIMPCKHLFHKDCVDEWLRVNASCPTCRWSIINRPDGNTNSGDVEGGDPPEIPNHRNVHQSSQISSTGGVYTSLYTID